jgi:putative membrane protein
VADIFFPAEGVAYLGTQGDIWDAQKDMGIAFIGAVLAMLFISSIRKFK